MNNRDLLIANGMVIDPSQGISEVREVMVRNGRIAALGAGLDRGIAEVFDASGLLVMPGFIDMHAHLREPGDEESETIATGCESAARGGFTAVCAMPNTNPATDDAGRVRYILGRAEGCAARVYPVGAITCGRAGKELVEMAEMIQAGAVGFSDDGCSVADARIMMNALRYAAMVGKPIIAHEEDPALDAGGQMNNGNIATELGLPGMPSIAEEIMVMRDIALAEYTGTRLHITHISTRGTVDIIRAAKARGAQVTCDVTPHHLALTEDAVATFDTRFKVNPPLRARADADALREGLKDGTIDAIATDHAPHYIERKECEFLFASFGATGLETAVGVIQKELVDTGMLAWSDVAEKMSAAPARILGIEGGTLREGAVADITIYDPGAAWTVDPATMASKSANTPFIGWTLPGRAVATVVGGMLHVRRLSPAGK